MFLGEPGGGVSGEFDIDLDLTGEGGNIDKESVVESENLLRELERAGAEENANPNMSENQNVNANSSGGSSGSVATATNGTTPTNTTTPTNATSAPLSPEALAKKQKRLRKIQKLWSKYVLAAEQEWQRLARERMRFELEMSRTRAELELRRLPFWPKLSYDVPMHVRVEDVLRALVAPPLGMVLVGFGGMIIT
jgi:hypothetical protein